MDWFWKFESVYLRQTLDFNLLIIWNSIYLINQSCFLYTCITKQMKQHKYQLFGGLKLFKRQVLKCVIEHI